MFAKVPVGEVLDGGVPPDRVLALGGAHAERVVLEVGVADVLDADQAVLGLVRPGRVAPRARGALRVGRPGLDRLVRPDDAAGGRRQGARLEGDLPVDGVRAAEEQRAAGVARAAQRVAHGRRVVLVVPAGDDRREPEGRGRVAVEVGGRGVGDVVALALEPAHHAEVAVAVPVALAGPHLLVGPVVRDLHRAGGARDGVGAGGVEVVEGLAAVVVVGLVGRVRQQVHDVRGRAVVADGQDDLVVRAVAADELDDVDAAEPRRRGGQRVGGRPVGAVEQAGVGRRRAGRLGDARQARDRGHQAALVAAVVAGAVDLDVVGRGAGGVDLQRDGLAGLDAALVREALDAALGRRSGVAGAPGGGAREAVLGDDRVGAGAGLARDGPHDVAGGAVDAAAHAADGVVVGGAVGRGGVAVGGGGDAAGRGQLRGDRGGRRAAQDGVVVGAGHGLPGQLDRAGQGHRRRARGGAGRRPQRGPGGQREERQGQDHRDEPAGHASISSTETARRARCHSTVAARPSSRLVRAVKPMRSRALVTSGTRLMTSSYLPGSSE